MADHQSQALFERARRLMPGGVNSPVRAFGSVGGDPVFVREAKGAWVTGVDGTRYVDYIGSWGPMILGHADPDVIAAIQEAAARGTSYGIPTAAEVDMAELLAEIVPSIEMSRLTSSGTEAVMGAVRVARGFTGRDVIVKCVGGYHGGADYLLVKAGSGMATFGVPDSGGVPEGIAKTTALLRYNDLDAARALFDERGSEIAAIVVEPVAGNMGCVPPEPGWLEGLAEIAHAHGALLIFDEVMTGFRLALGGAQERYGVTPDLTCLAKVAGGGMPLGAYGGRREIMERVAPSGPVYQAGTLSGNPVAVAAGLVTLRKLREPGIYDRLEAIGDRLARMLSESLAEADAPTTVQRVGAMVTPFFHDGPVRSWDEAAACDTAAFGRWHAALLAAGVYWPPSQYEAGFPSLAHDDAAFAHTEAALAAAAKAV